MKRISGTHFYLYSCCFLLFFFACSPLDREYNPQTVEEDLQTLREIEVPEPDVLLLEGYIKAQQMNNIEIDSTLSYEDLLLIAKTEKMRLEVNWYISDLSERIKQERITSMIDSLNSFFTLLLKDKSYDHDAFREYIGLELLISNKSAIDIKGIKGEIKFYDLFGDLLKRAEIKCDSSIAAGKELSFYARIDYNYLIDNDLKFFQMDYSKFTTQFIPREIIFADGKKISY